MVRPIERMAERRQIPRAAEEALEDAPTDPRLPMIVLPEEILDDDPRRDDLPPGFTSGHKYANGYAPHPATSPTFTTLTFRAMPEPWYRTNPAKIALLVVGLAATVTSVVMFLWPTSGPAPQDAAATTAPAPSPSASPTPTQSGSPSLLPSAVPPLVGLPLPPPPPPPPAEPPPAAPEQQPRYYPRYSDPSQQKPPQVDVTRAPISVAPSIKQAPATATPGHNKGGGWGW